jgi:Class III cytochrome C family
MSLRSISTELPRDAPGPTDTPAPTRSESCRAPRGRSCAAAVGLALIALLGARAADAVDWQRMVMPGPLSQAHADLEKDCASCHKAFESGAERQLCMSCHEEVAADVAARTGYHGRQSMALNSPCRSCHGEHKGREADIGSLSEATFDHDRTDHALRGAHRQVACIGCHVAGKRRDAAPGKCVDCHR